MVTAAACRCHSTGQCILFVYVEQSGDDILKGVGLKCEQNSSRLILFIHYNDQSS